MIQDNVILRQKLLETFQSLSAGFDTALSDAKQQEVQFNRDCGQFQQRMGMVLSDANKNLSKQNPMSSQIQAFMDLLQNTSEQWDLSIKKQDKGVAFRENFNDSLMVFVYGKVKSGKSSLGNYVAWGHTDPSNELKKNTEAAWQPKYFSGQKTDVKSGDKEHEAEANKEFRVGATEATSTIQGFKLPGLTWIDSPGLHSVNAENGQLAKDYVAHSDVILYTMKSDSPGRESDLKEILELYRADKRIVLLLTGSDDVKTLGFDKEARKPLTQIVMKDKQRRASQKAYIYSALNAIPELSGKTANIEIVSFSARYAQLHPDDVDAFQDSGMGELFRVIHETAATEGVRLKQQTPLVNFKKFIQKFQSSLQLYGKSISDFQMPLTQLKKSIPIEVKQQLNRIQNQMADQISLSFASLNEFRDDAMQMQAQLKSVNATLQQSQAALLLTAQISVLEKVMDDFGSQITETFQNSALLYLPEFSVETKTETIISGLKPSTKNRNGGIGALLGGVIGAGLGLFAGGVGAFGGFTAGSLIGKTLGGKTGSDAQTLTKDITLNVGDNLSDIHEQTLDVFRDSLHQRMDDFQKALLKNALEDAEGLVQALQQELGKMEHKIAQLHTALDEKLTA